MPDEPSFEAEICAALDAGDKKKLKSLSRQFDRTNCDDYIGIFVGKDRVRDALSSEYLELLEGEVSEDRYEALADGAAMTEEERALIVKSVLERASWNTDGNEQAYFIAELHDGQGHRVIAAVSRSGCSFEGVSANFRGFYRSVDDLKAELQQDGYLVE